MFYLMNVLLDVGLRWLTWACAGSTGLRGLSWAYVDCRGLALAFVGLLGLVWYGAGARKEVWVCLTAVLGQKRGPGVSKRGGRIWWR